MTIVDVIIPSRDRPEDLARCLPTILANDHPQFEVIVVDQSTTNASERVVADLADPRLRYHRQHDTGKSQGVNAALAQAKGDVMAFADDDCTVPPDWLRRAVAVLAKESEVGIVFGAVAAAPHDPRTTFVPEFRPPRYRRLRRRLVRAHHSGIEANMVVRRVMFERIGGFDEFLGPGSRFRSGADWDLAYRALRTGFALVHDPANVVVLWGRREYATGAFRRLIANNYHGVGAGYARHARRTTGPPSTFYCKKAC